jgi:hypothetical protein
MAPPVFHLRFEFLRSLSSSCMTGDSTGATSFVTAGLELVVVIMESCLLPPQLRDLPPPPLTMIESATVDVLFEVVSIYIEH